MQPDLTTSKTQLIYSDESAVDIANIYLSASFGFSYIFHFINKMIIIDTQ